ncbi:Zinc finger Ran-binding domain-containing protein 2 [Eumeta japonica]|uniref:Zinc finger Ran-binding domain-containing protein 2 n=1 Tax=Eumeta variegata TaxID=151549 RepID=A0A4C1T3W4_EUMVA|nr:Zinc finger Ran-binding domain-containing protein 2 [Eumeta japonica]
MQRDRSLSAAAALAAVVQAKKLGTEIGKAARKNRVAYSSAEDWQCNKCANVNWPRRMTCNMCNAPKFCDVEERTGFGGGYNDRGVVEYKEREESDSEYDEFGRLKKRVKNSFNSESRRIKTDSKQERSSEEEEDDDDEDGDDGDLAKYNLFSDDEDVIPSSNTKSSKKCPDLKDENNSVNMMNTTSRRSRSRTRSDYKRRQSNSSSRSSSSTSTSSSSSSSTSSSSTSSSTENSSKLQAIFCPELRNDLILSSEVAAVQSLLQNDINHLSRTVNK